MLILESKTQYETWLYVSDAGYFVFRQPGAQSVGEVLLSPEQTEAIIRYMKKNLEEAHILFDMPRARGDVDVE